MKKKLLLLPLLFSMSLTLVAVIFVEPLRVNAINLLVSSNQVWGHYLGVAADENKPGCNEFWISCNTHDILLEEPEEGQIIERGAPTYEQIASWKNDGSGRYISKLSGGDTLTNVTLDKAYYQILYDNGESFEQEFVGENELIECKYPKKNGYCFAGWFTNPDCLGSAFNFSQSISSDLHLYAKWVEHQGDASISFNATSIHLSEDVYAAFYPLCNTYVSIMGFHDDSFGALYDSNFEKYGTYTEYLSGEYGFSISASLVAGEIYYLTGGNIENDYGCNASISHSSIPTGGRGLANTSNVSLTFGESYSLPVMEKEYFDFKGWFDADGVQYTDENGFSLKVWDRLESITLHPEWNKRKTRVHYILNGGTISGELVCEVEYFSEYNFQIPTRSKWTFAGYYSEGTMVNKLSNINKSWSHFVDDLYLYAGWYKLSIERGGGFAYDRDYECYCTEEIDANSAAYANFVIETNACITFTLHYGFYSPNENIVGYVNENGTYTGSVEEETNYTSRVAGENKEGKVEIPFNTNGEYQTAQIGIKIVNLSNTYYSAAEAYYSYEIQ